MTASVIGCGKSAEGWQNTPCDLSIGCNDVRRFGFEVDWLVVVNRFFVPERDAIIKNSKPKRFLTNSAAYWPKFFPKAEVLRMQQYGKYLKKGHVYSSKTSPFVAMSLAFNSHADTIILHGVDMVDHPNIKGKTLNYELRQYERFCRQLNDLNTKIFVSSKESKLSEFLPVYVPKNEDDASHAVRGLLYDINK